ncbi:hypothetical protein FAGKG844_330055 [Frankia sp. AgKG'84/4]
MGTAGHRLREAIPQVSACVAAVARLWVAAREERWVAGAEPADPNRFDRFRLLRLDTGWVLTCYFGNNSC